jgi:hypothetical protein
VNRVALKTEMNIWSNLHKLQASDKTGMMCENIYIKWLHVHNVIYLDFYISVSTTQKKKDENLLLFTFFMRCCSLVGQGQKSVPASYLFRVITFYEETCPGWESPWHSTARPNNCRGITFSLRHSTSLFDTVWSQLLISLLCQPEIKKIMLYFLPQ